MKQVLSGQPQEEYLRILGKGMITIPKEWRDELGLSEGEIVKAQKIGKRVVIESETEEWLKEDKVPEIKVYSMGKAKDDLRRVQIYDHI